MAVKLRIGDRIFDADARRLTRGTEEVQLSPKAFALLSILLEQRPRALSKQELHGQLWPATFVSDTNLATLIGEIRAALGDTARKPRYVRTAHRFGYAFCGEAIESGKDDPDQAATFCWLIRDGQRLPLAAGENVIGRDTAGGVHIDSVTVSRRHARIVISGTGAVLEDLRSKNGTFVDGQPIAKPTPLADGVEIRTGSIVFRFRMSSPTGSTATWSKTGG